MTKLMAVREERKLQIKYEKNVSDVAWLKLWSDLEEKSTGIRLSVIQGKRNEGSFMLAIGLVSEDKCDSNMADDEDGSCQINSQSFDNF